MRTTLHSLFIILLVIQLFTQNSSFALELDIPITDTSDLNERVIQSSTYRDNTILLRLAKDVNYNPSTGLICSANEINLKLIHRNGTIRNLNISVQNEMLMLAENFCIPLSIITTPTHSSPFITPPPFNVIGNEGSTITLPISSLISEGGIILDGIRIYALQQNFILLTYFCRLEIVEGAIISEICGSLINWNKEVKYVINFGQNCSDSDIVVRDEGEEFLRACYLSDRKQVIWTRYTINSNEETIVVQDSGTIINVNQFSPNLTEIFPTENGGYGIVTAQYTGEVNSLFLPPWTLFLQFISPSRSNGVVRHASSISSAFQLYKQTTESLTSLDIHKCGIAYQGYGYNCIIYMARATGLAGGVFVNIDFLDSGGVLNTTEFRITPVGIFPNVIKIESFYYGGYLILIQNVNVEGLIYSNNGTEMSDGWHMPASIVTGDGGVIPLNYTSNVGVLSNNTFWCVANSDDGVKLITNDLLTNLSTISDPNMLAYGNPFIESTSPKINDVIPRDITSISITFTNLIELSTGNVSIWQTSNNNDSSLDVLRQSFSATQSQFVRLEDRRTVNIMIFNSTFNTPGVSYYVKVDNGFVEDLRVGQNLPGIREHRWMFKTGIDERELISADSLGSVKAIVRLTPGGTKFYESLSSPERDEFSKQMSAQLSKMIPCDPPRLVTLENSQYDPATQFDQLLLRVDVRPQNNGGLQGVDNSLSSLRIINDLNVLIINKDYTDISRGNFSSMLDNRYGSKVIPDLWLRYRWILIGFSGALILLLLLFWFARRKYQHGRNYVIFLFTIIAVDLGLDISFIIMHGNDLKWLYPVSVVFLVFPILINVLSTFMIITRETGKEKDFLNWWRDNSKTALVFTLFSGIDVEALNIINSECGGINELSAPLADITIERILIVNGVVLFLEDIPQLVIYIFYQSTTVIPAIIPILVLSSCCVVLTLKSIGLMYFCIIYHKAPPSSFKVDEKGKKKATDFYSSGPYRTESSIDTSELPPKQLFANNKGGGDTTPESIHILTTDNGETKVFMRHPDEFKNLDIKMPTSIKRVKESTVEDGSSIEPGQEGGISDIGIIESTEGPVIGSSSKHVQGETIGDKEYKDIQPTEAEISEEFEPVKVVPTYRSKLIEQFDIDPEDIKSGKISISTMIPVQKQIREEPQEPQPSTSRRIVSSISRALGGSKKGKGGQDSKKGKSKDDDKDQKKDDNN
ncbi:3125_t:CDS:2 [Funneliformis mosseae]|uniref:3125_t:CDS:1 n=1 Tax=Funneliformis mosseae TaxID=27381 RepID=A0A9N9H7Y8_FUNMO|nr:3125_t:CDS:2 [Funneliformis mosseae]